MIVDNEHYDISDYEDEEVDDDGASDCLEHEDDAPGICSNCSGSGEGMFDGSVCYVCKGRGVA